MIRRAARSALAGSLLVGTIVPAPLRAAPSSGSDPQVVVGPLDVVGPLSDHWRATIDAGLHRGLTRAGLARATAPAATCQDLTCLQEHARTRGAMAVIVASVDSEDRFYRVRITAFDTAAGTGAPMATVEEECPICGPGEVAALIERQAAVLARKLPTTRLPGILAVRSTPPGAAVAVDGEPAGHSPLELELSAGEHTVRATAEGYEPLERRVTATSRVRETWAPRLRAIEQPESIAQRRLRIAGWASLGGAGAAMVPAIVFLALDRRPFPLSCSGEMLDADGDCERLYHTLPHGAAFLGVSAALAIAGGVLLSRSRQPTRPGPAARRLRPAANGVAVTF